MTAANAGTNGLNPMVVVDSMRFPFIEGEESSTRSTPRATACR